ncbi:MAG: hypothetical protein Q8O91_10255 [Candidatus Aminicenantes bacterium]|nr:hypothetical protein [Candidatus Aminicenantes bacterium]
MAKSKRAYKSAKRNKELDRLKKREEKRRRRLGGEKPADADGPAPEGSVPEGEGAPKPETSEPQ